MTIFYFVRRRFISSRSLPRLLPDLTGYMSNTAGVLEEEEIAFPSRVPELTPELFGGVRLFVCCHIMCLYVLGFFV